MKQRLYEFISGIETSTQPDAGTPTLSNDLVTLSYVSGSLGTEAQEEPTGTVNGSNVTFTLANTPVSSSSVKLYLNGIFQRQGTDYTISSATITMATAPVSGQVLDANYRY